jgi:transcriptional regulator with XRE-family HTH domain
MSKGKRLKQARESIGLSQADLGEPLNFAYSKIRDLESGKQKVTMEIAAGLEEKFSISSNWIVTGEGDMFVNGESNTAGYQSPAMTMNGGNHHIDVHNGDGPQLSPDVAYLVSLLEGMNKEQIKEVISFAMGIK